MALANEDIKRLIHQLEADRQAYLSSHTKLQETLIRILSDQAEGGPCPSITDLTPLGASTPSSPVAQPESFLGGSSLPSYGGATFTLEPVAPKKSHSISSRKTAPSTVAPTLATRGRKVTSVYSAEDSSDSEEGETFFAHNPLPTENFTEEQLRQHIRNHNWNDLSKLILGELRRSGKLHRRASIFEPEVIDDLHDADHTLGDIYEVGEDGAPLNRSRSDSKHADADTWEILRCTNPDKSRKQAVGRIVILREPTPLLFAALHLTMSRHFDMDSLYEILIDDTTTTKAYIEGHASRDPRQQRSVLFSFKYHTLVGKDRSPLHFQNHDPNVHDKDDHIPLSTCSSVVALSLSGPALRSYRRHSRRSKTAETSHVHDPFAPWHVLSLQCFPDWHSEVNLHETHHHYVNGVDAFMATLINEYRDAGKRFRVLTSRIAKLATPLKEIIFNSNMRDNLLFETGDFVWSRRYFWASQTLGVLSDELDAMVQAYKETFTDEVWAGEHKTLFPGTSDTSARYSNWRKKLGHQRKLFEREIENLKEIRRFCDREQKDIKGLREWLFSGTSVQESRKAVEQASITVEQGYNIKLLTLVTIFFLPLTFVTSVYGMTNMDPNEGFLHFGITVVTVCIPTYFLIGIINYETFQKTVAYLAWPVVWTIANTKKSMDWAHRYRDKYMWRTWKLHGEGTSKDKVMTRAQTFASLQHRLSMERSADRVPQVIDSSGEVVEKTATNSSFDMAATLLPTRESTIRWDTPNSIHQPVNVQEPSPNTSVPELSKAGEPVVETPLQMAGSARRERVRDQSSTRGNLLRKLSAKVTGEPAEAHSPV